MLRAFSVIIVEVEKRQEVIGNSLIKKESGEEILRIFSDNQQAAQQLLINHHNPQTLFIVFAYGE